MNNKRFLIIGFFSFAVLAQSTFLQAQRMHPQFEPPRRAAYNLECQTPAANAQNAPALSSSNFYNGINAAGKVIGESPDWYYQISSSIEDLDGWLAATAPKSRILLPFNDKAVTIRTGWMYNAEARHNALDYGAANTFPVRAVAAGKVIWVGYNPSPGNVVIIEHGSPTSRGSQHFRTIYHHLRNGRDNDLTLARATLQHSLLYNLGWENVSSQPTEYIRLYQSDADKDTKALMMQTIPMAQRLAIEERWGTNDQKLLVKVGDTVKSGQQIGWAGTTGFDTYGVHLHIMFARIATHNNNGTKQSLWTLFDPYGLYTLPLSCYETPNASGKGSKQHPSYFGQPK